MPPKRSHRERCLEARRVRTWLLTQPAGATAAQIARALELPDVLPALLFLRARFFVVVEERAGRLPGARRPPSVWYSAEHYRRMSRKSHHKSKQQKA